jgi:magnesium chelatase subunit I
VDEVNLLEDHLVDLLLDAAATGENVVEREGVSVRHPARFVLVGSGNPEEGELRPQLLDRFGLAVDVKTPTVIACASR